MKQQLNSVGIGSILTTKDAKYSAALGAAVTAFLYACLPTFRDRIMTMPTVQGGTVVKEEKGDKVSVEIDPYIHPSTLWAALKAEYEKSDPATLLRLETEFRSVKQGDRSLSDFITDIRLRAMTIENCGRKIDDTMKLHALFTGIRDETNHLVSFITTLMDDDD